jgi:hypothetical protein
VHQMFVPFQYSVIIAILFDLLEIIADIRRRVHTTGTWKGNTWDNEDGPAVSKYSAPKQPLSPSSRPSPRKRTAVTILTVKPPSPKPQIEKKTAASAKVETSIEFAPLEHRPPPLKALTITSKTEVETVDQLVQMLQLATHKLNDLHGTVRRHCKVLKLYNIAGLESDPEDVNPKAPSLAQLAKHMKVNVSELQKWYSMYRLAESSEFDFRKHADDLLSRHREAFFGAKSVVTVRQLCRVIQQATAMLNELHGTNAKKRKLQLSDLFGTTKKMRVTSVTQTQLAEAMASSQKSLKKWHRMYQRGVRRNFDFEGLGDDKISHHADIFKRDDSFVEVEEEDMEEGEMEEEDEEEVDESDASSDDVVIGISERGEVALENFFDGVLLNATHGFDVETDAMVIDNIGGDSSLRHVDTHAHEADGDDSSLAGRNLDDPTPGQIEITDGSRVFVKREGDESLYRATVQHILHDGDALSIKIHYDGKKSHILDDISLGMIVGCIDDGDDVQDTSSGTHDATAIKLPLRRSYPAILPAGELEHEEPCPELGPGWLVRVVARRGQQASAVGQKNPCTDRYFITPAGKSIRSIPELERYYTENPGDFICSNEAASSVGVVPVNLTAKTEGGGVQNKMQTSSSIASGRALLQCQLSGHAHGDTPGQEHTSVQEGSGLPFNLYTDNFSPLMGHEAENIEDTHSDHEFLSELMDEKGFLFGEDVTPSEQVRGNAADLQTQSNDVDIDIEPISVGNGHEATATTPLLTSEEKKKKMSPRMKQNKKSLKNGMVPVFAMNGDSPRAPDVSIEDSCTDEDEGSDDEVSFINDGTSKPSAARQAQGDDASDDKTEAVTSLQNVNASDSVDKNIVAFTADAPPTQKIIDNQAESNVAPRHASTLSQKDEVKPNKASSVITISPISFLQSRNGKNGDKTRDSSIHDPNTPRSDKAAASSAAPSTPRQSHHEMKPLDVQSNSLNVESLSAASTNRPSSNDAPLKSLTNSPNEVVAIDLAPSNSAFAAVSKVIQPKFPPPVFPVKDEGSSNSHAGKEDDESVQLFAFNYDAKESTGFGRPKRKLKSIVRFEPLSSDSRGDICKAGHGFLCPRCSSVCLYDSKKCMTCQLECYYEAGVGVVSLRERNVSITEQAKDTYYASGVNQRVKNQRELTSTKVRTEGILCNCYACDRQHFSVQGIYAHYGRSHSAAGKLDWTKVTFSCPFCKSSPSFKSLKEADAHVDDRHPGSSLLKPNTDKSPRKRTHDKLSADESPFQLGVRNDESSQSVARSLRSVDYDDNKRVLRTRSPVSYAGHSKVANAIDEANPSWTKLDFRRLLPDSRKDYPRELSNVLDLVSEQCDKQENITNAALEQRLKLCKNEADMEAKAWDEDRLAYQRGIRERTRLADAERIEKEKFNENSRLMLMQYEYENRNKRRTQEDIEVEKLCSKPIIFGRGKERHLSHKKEACKNEQCQLCKKDSMYLQSVLLDDEMSQFDTSAPPSETPALATSKVLNPSFQEIDEHYLMETEQESAAKSSGDHLDGSKRVNQSRRDAATAKRLRTEEEKLYKMKKMKHSLEFIRRYNDGLLKNAWGEPQRKRRPTK